MPQQNSNESIRIGITIPKKAGNAVQRNRWKRWIRESFRLQRENLPSGYDIVVRPKRGASPNWTAIERSIPHLAHQAAHQAAKRAAHQAAKRAGQIQQE